MYQRFTLRRLACLLILLVGGLWWSKPLIGPAAANPPVPTPTTQPRRFGSVFILPPVRPTAVPNGVFHPLLAVPFAPILPNLETLTGYLPPDVKGRRSPRRWELPVASPTPPAVPRATPTPTPSVPDGVINIVLLGTDRRPQWGDWRTDTIIVVSINPQARFVSLLSIPRDLWVRIPGFGVGRINTVDFIGEWKKAEGGGPGLLKRTIEANLGLPIHRYARIDLEGFIRVIDTLGGVTIDVECPIHDTFLDAPLTGKNGPAELKLDVGVYHMDGLTALRYVRSRRQGLDFDRARRQQKLLRSLAEQYLNLGLLPKLPQLWETLQDAVQTDLTLSEIVQLAYIGLQVQQNRIKSRFIDWRVTDNFVTAEGAQVLLPNREKLAEAVAEFLNPPQEDIRLLAEEARIEVLNGTTKSDLERIAARRLKWAGLTVTRVGTGPRVSATRVIVYAVKPHTLGRVLTLLGVDATRVVRSPEPSDEADIRVVLGDDWDACR